MNEQTVIDLARSEHLDRQRRSAAGRRDRGRRTVRTRTGAALVRWGTRLSRMGAVPAPTPARRVAAASR